jgi:DNA polymerase elongation subunit (family B)
MNVISNINNNKLSFDDLRLNRPYVKPEGNVELQLVDVQENIYGPSSEDYRIELYCIDSKSNSYCIRVKNFKPFFYVDVEDRDYEKTKKKLLNMTINDKFKSKILGTLITNKKTRRKMIEKKVAKPFDKYQPIKKMYAKLSFNNMADFRATSRHFKENDLNIYESNIPQLIRFLHRNEINASGWIKIHEGNYQVIDKKNHYSNCQYELTCNWTDIKKSNKMDIGPFIVASYDIECISDTGDFPQATNKKDTITQIGTTVEMFGNPDWQYNYIVTLGSCDPIDNCHVVSCKTEQEVLMQWANFMRLLDPDIVTGYNILNFDYEYLYLRAKMHAIEKDFCCFGRVKDVLGNDRNINQSDPKYDFKVERKIYEVKKLSSSAMGDNVMKSIKMEGRVNLDLLKYVRDSGDKLASYKLDNVAFHYLKQNKNDVTPQQIFEFQRQGPDKRKLQKWVMLFR